MFRQRSADLRQSVRTRECKSKTSVYILIALTDIIKIVKFFGAETCSCLILVTNCIL